MIQASIQALQALGRSGLQAGATSADASSRDAAHGGTQSGRLPELKAGSLRASSSWQRMEKKRLQELGWSTAGFQESIKKDGKNPKPLTL